MAHATSKQHPEQTDVGTIFIRLKDENARDRAAHEIRDWLEGYGWAHAVAIRVENESVNSEIQLIAGPLQSNDSCRLVFKTDYRFDRMKAPLEKWLSEIIQNEREILIEG